MYRNVEKNDTECLKFRYEWLKLGHLELVHLFFSPAIVKDTST